jgi:hypothetical protein
MRHSRGTAGKSWVGALACGACGAWVALSGCYDAVEGEGEARPDDIGSHQDRSSSNPPPIAGAPAPVGAGQPEPTVPPEDVPDDPEPKELPVDDTSVSFQAEPGFTFVQNGQIVGDLDGDGFDDFVLFALVEKDLDVSIPESAAYVFYGRADLPRVMDVTRADAVLRGAGFAMPIPEFNASASGDFDGDGLADLVFGSVDGAHFVFGSEERLVGDHDIADVGIRWSMPEPPMSTIGWPVRIAAAGDVDGDGLTDVMLTLTTDEFVIEFEDSVSSSPIDSTYLVLGRSGEWPTGTFEPDWAEAAFVVDEAQYGGCAMSGAADLNGDGVTDLVLKVETAWRLLPGGDALTGTVEVIQAGEAFDLPAGALRALPDLDGDGRQEVAWTDAVEGDRLYVTYGTSDLDPIELLEPDFVVRADGMKLPATAATDFDGDGTIDLLLVAGGTGRVLDGVGSVPFGLYLLPTEGLHRTGEVGLDDARLLLALPDAGSALEAPLGTAIDAGGDVNGDGLDDLLISTMTPDSTPVGESAVWLLPGGTQARAR